MRPTNLLVLLSDEHQRDITGCYGNRLVQTPHLDRLAARGARFDAAYTPCPICVPARASLATGREVHQTACWDNAHPFHGQFPSWHSYLRDRGHPVVSIGKLHFRSSDDDNGFSEEILPLHVLDGVGDLLGLLRRPPAPRGNMPALARDVGGGFSDYNDYDDRITAAACDWLKKTGGAPAKPWTLFVSWVRPHFPLIAPPEFFRRYPPERMPLPRLLPDGMCTLHPAVQGLRDCMNYHDYFDESAMRRAVAAYYALVSFLDANVGKVLAALEDTGLAGETRVLYTSDHGDNLGARGLWGKSVMYEESAAIPLIIAGPDVPAGKAVHTTVSLVDVYRSAIECAGYPAPQDRATRRSESLWAIADGLTPDRPVLSEYHAAGSITGSFMIRKDRWKYIHHASYGPELFDLDTDPGETQDLGPDPAFAVQVARCEAALREILDPEDVNEQAFADQARKIAQHGGAQRILERGDFGFTPAPGAKAGFA